MVFQLATLVPTPATLASCGRIWNAACGPDLHISADFIERNLLPSAGVLRGGRVAVDDQNNILGFILVSTNQEKPGTFVGQLQPMAWVDAIAVHSDAQRAGIGSALINWGRTWLSGRGISKASMGAGLRPFAPGLFAALNNDGIFRKLGFEVGDRDTWDVATDMDTDLRLRPLPGTCMVRPASDGDFVLAMSFMQREFPGRWTYELAEHIREHQDPAEFLLLFIDGAVEGFAHVTFEHSTRPIERWYMHGLLRPWGQLGPIGVSAHIRGSGFGGAMLSGGLAHLKSAGVRACVIDWTSLTNFYAKWGFKKYRQYVRASVALEP